MWKYNLSKFDIIAYRLWRVRHGWRWIQHRWWPSIGTRSCARPVCTSLAGTAAGPVCRWTCLAGVTTRPPRESHRTSATGCEVPDVRPRCNLSKLPSCWRTRTSREAPTKKTGPWNPKMTTTTTWTLERTSGTLQRTQKIAIEGMF